MIKKNFKLMLVVGVMFASVSMMSPVAHADLAPGEGAYLGGFVGYSSGLLQPEITTKSLQINGTLKAKDGGLGLGGIEGGGWLGYGYSLGDVYLGFEIEGAGAGAEIDLTSDTAINISASASSITTMKASRNWQAGGAFRLGYYINKDSLFALKGGISVSEFAVDTGSNTEDVYAGGPQVGASLTSRLSGIDPNLSLRLDFTYTDYLEAEVGGIGGGKINNRHTTLKVSGSDTAARLGLTYSF
ncbi:MAG: hypothetical protein QGG38_05175 [Nitrospinaceae bacterium]|nr:hypothetical protein [Nitrospinaceae bacterium]